MPKIARNFFGGIVLYCCFLGNAMTQTHAEIRKEIDKIIFYDTEILDKEIPCFLIGMVYGDSVFTFSFEGHELKQGPLGDSTVFELGGLSKVFTATLIEVLVQEGKMEYQKPFNEYMDHNFKNPEYQNLTILDLVTHQSGMPRLPHEFGAKEKEKNNPYAHYTKRDLLTFYKKLSSKEESNKEYFYSGVNYALLEIAIENVCKTDFETVLNQKILGPLNMAQSFIHTNPSRGKTPTPGYSIAQKPVRPLRFQSFAASEGVKSTMRDLLHFLKANIGFQTYPLSSTFQNTHEPFVATKMNKIAQAGKGWHVLSLKKYYSAILHSGSTNGHRAYIGFVKETKTGVIVLSNSEHGLDGLGFLILRMLNNDWRKKKRKSRK